MSFQSWSSISNSGGKDADSGSRSKGIASFASFSGSKNFSRPSSNKAGAPSIWANGSGVSKQNSWHDKGSGNGQGQGGVPTIYSRLCGPSLSKSQVAHNVNLDDAERKMTTLDMNGYTLSPRDTNGKDATRKVSPNAWNSARSSDSPNHSIASSGTSFNSRGSQKLLSYNSSRKEVPSGPKSWANVVSGPTKGSKNSMVIRPKAAPLVVMPRSMEKTDSIPDSPNNILGPAPHSAGPYETSQAELIPGQVRILQRSESDSFAHSSRPVVDKNSFVPEFIQLQQGSGGQERFLNGGRQKELLGSDASFAKHPSPAHLETKSAHASAASSSLPFVMPDRFENLSPQEVVDHLRKENKYNPGSLVLNFKNARSFVAKCDSEDDVMYSIAHGVWSTSVAGNHRLDSVFSDQQQDAGPIYLFFTVSGSNQFCGMTEVLSGLQCPDRMDISPWEKWRDRFLLKWIFVKDVPNDLLRHVTTDDKRPVTIARDCAEIPLAEAKQMAKVIQTCPNKTNIMDSFVENCALLRKCSRQSNRQ